MYGYRIIYLPSHSSDLNPIKDKLAAIFGKLFKQTIHDIGCINFMLN